MHGKVWRIRDCLWTGKFLFDYIRNESWDSGMVIELDIDTRMIDFIPIQRFENTVRELDPVKGKKFLMVFSLEVTK